MSTGDTPHTKQFLDLMFEPGSAKYFDYRNPQGILQDYQFDADDKIIERNKIDWEKNQNMWKFRGFKLYSVEKKNTPNKKKKAKEDV